MKVVILCRKKIVDVRTHVVVNFDVIWYCWVVVVDVMSRAKPRGCCIYRGSAAEISVDKNVVE